VFLNSRRAAVSLKFRPCVFSRDFLAYIARTKPHRAFLGAFFCDYVCGGSSRSCFLLLCSAFQLSLSESQLGAKHILKKIMSLNKKLMIDGDL